ncbi:MAG: SUMF1/EgtB/PvdO family nonheme iron enzyme [Burkholderiaceae bacterium]|nr:SUMF1/EgtB/PvdO family nonheme iron enzyme [Burkholderiaceae bacterium]
MVAPVDDPTAARSAGRDWLSLALIDARNHTLRWLAAIEASPAGPLRGTAGMPPALWLAGHAAWYADWWILRHVHAGRGEAGDPTRPRLAPAEAASDRCFHAETRGVAPPMPPPDEVRAWMADTLEQQLDLLAGTPEHDTALYLHRQALRHEDRITETLAVLADHLDVADAPWPDERRVVDAGPLWLPAQTWSLGSPQVGPGGGLVPGPERWAHPVPLPETEIDSRPVSWARFAEFVTDGGYDEPHWWTPAGWDWAQAAQRRAPQRVEQMGAATVVQRRGRLQQVPAAAAVAHVTRHEALAWCAWAGRRLPVEAEWEAAAVGALRRGFVWGEVLEWVAGSARAFPGHADPPGEIDPLPGSTAEPGAWGVLRGACALTPARAVHPRARRFARVDDDVLPTGFRSCAR